MMSAIRSWLRSAACCIAWVASTALAASLSACGDPGTGGSGIPSSGGAPSNATGASGVPTAADFAISGIVEAVNTQSVTINGQSYASSQLEIVLRDGSTGSLGALAPGQSVGLSSIANSSPARWTLRILSP